MARGGRRGERRENGGGDGEGNERI